MTKVCASTLPKNFAEAKFFGEVSLAKGAEMIEFRLDNFSEENFSFFTQPIETIATFRGDEKKSFEMYDAALQAGAEYLDIDVLLAAHKNFPRKKIIASYHNFEKTFDRKKILEIFFELKSFGVPKAAFMVRSVTDLLEIFSAAKVLKESSEPFILIGMGEPGKVTRVRAKLLGSCINYAAVSKNYFTAPGQLTLDEVNQLQTPMVTGVIGYPLTHTKSPEIHNAAFEKAKISGYYLKIPTEESELCLLKELMKCYGITGLNVTIPHKVSVKKYLDEVTPQAKAAGSVNTVLFRGEKMIGFNTDIFGIAASLEKLGVNPEDARVLLIGAGGAARAAAYYLREKNSHITITNRTEDSAKKLGQKFCASVKSLDELTGNWDVIINATPGAAGENFPEKIFSGTFAVFDMVYEPAETPFLLAAKNAGVKNVLNGETMLIEQAAASFALFTGVEPDKTVMEKAFEGGI